MTAPISSVEYGQRRDLAGAVIVPPFENKFKQKTGILTAEGEYVRLGETRRLGAAMTIRPEPVGPNIAHLPGRWLWGGMMMDHFGHFMVESLARVWRCHVLNEPLDGVVFVHKRPGWNGELAPFQAAVLAAFGVTLPVLVVREPHTVDELIVTEQSLWLGDRIEGEAPMRDVVWQHFGADIAADGPDRLYVSRSRMPDSAGAVLVEAEIEAALAVDGYTMFHPQDHPVETQIARYKAARQIIFCDGSGAHLFAFVARPSQQVAYLPRRRTWFDGPIGHIKGFSRRKPRLLPFPAREWLPKERRRFRNVNYPLHDLDELGRALAEAEMIETLSAWRNPSADLLAARIAKIVPTEHFAETVMEPAQ